MFAWFKRKTKERLESDLLFAQSQLEYWINVRQEIGDYAPEYKEEESYWRKQVAKITRKLEKM